MKNEVSIKLTNVIQITAKILKVYYYNIGVLFPFAVVLHRCKIMITI